ncbi:MAG: hypothetical protein ACREAY_12070, partial [Nitrososphaera sp.]|uniref:hypothetical protein n=1 Tax=Nitrososphaera sp. TaxID=1971748 RepID=UPI003D6E46AF
MRFQWKSGKIIVLLYYIQLAAQKVRREKQRHLCFQRIGKNEGKCHSSFIRIAGLRFLSRQYFEPSNQKGIG